MVARKVMPLGETELFFQLFRYIKRYADCAVSFWANARPSRLPSVLAKHPGYAASQ